MEEIKRPLSWGAESNLYIINYLGYKAVLKERLRKPYMDPRLSEDLIKKRTITEAKILYEANQIGVPSPFPLMIQPEKGMLILTYIDGELVKNLLYNEGYTETIGKIIRQLGLHVSILHNHNIIHGDLTTSNIIYTPRNSKVYLIDYGLAFKSNRAEDKAMDLRIFESSIESTHSEHTEKILHDFYQSYTKTTREIELIIKQLEDIRKRGRYIKERRKPK